MICWFEAGVTDSFGPQLDGMRDGLGFLAGSACPHYDGEALRRPRYRELVDGGFPEGIAADDGVGLHYVGTELREVVTCRPGAAAYRVTRERRGAARSARRSLDARLPAAVRYTGLSEREQLVDRACRSGSCSRARGLWPAYCSGAGGSATTRPSLAWRADPPPLDLVAPAAKARIRRRTRVRVAYPFRRGTGIHRLRRADRPGRGALARRRLGRRATAGSACGPTRSRARRPGAPTSRSS